MSYMEPAKRFPLMFKLEESLPSKHANYVLTFYDNRKRSENRFRTPILFCRREIILA